MHVNIYTLLIEEAYLAYLQR